MDNAWDWSNLSFILVNMRVNPLVNAEVEEKLVRAFQEAKSENPKLVAPKNDLKMFLSHEGLLVDILTGGSLS